MFIVLHVKYAINYRPKNSFTTSYASHKVIFPGGVYQHQRMKDRIKDNLVGDGGSVTPLGLVTVPGSRNITR